MVTIGFNFPPLCLMVDCGKSSPIVFVRHGGARLGLLHSHWGFLDLSAHLCSTQQVAPLLPSGYQQTLGFNK